MNSGTTRLYYCALLMLVSIFLGCRNDLRTQKNGTKIKIGTAKGTATSSDANFLFTDVTEDCNIDVVYQNGRSKETINILQSLGGGAGLIDIDSDGWLDLFVPVGGGFKGRRTIFGLPSRLYRNLGGWRFAEVTDVAGDGFPTEHYSHGCFAGDYDNDGFDDFLVTGYGGLQLWKNQGDGTFEEIHLAADLNDELWSSAAAWGDIDNDGWLDLYVAHYVNWTLANDKPCTGVRPEDIDICPPKVYDPLPDVLFHNEGDGTFTDVTATAPLRKDGKGLGVITGDVDLDGDVDIYVANDTTENFLYINDGTGHFKEVAGISGVAVDERGTPNGSMGVDIGDYNLDGQPDIWVANFEVESFALYRNDGNGQFLHVSRATGVTALNGLFVGFGTAFLDTDLDGDEDILVNNGHVILHPRSAPLLQEVLLLVNDNAKRYQRHLFPKDSYFSQPHAGRGLATGDIDADGDFDLVLTNNLEKMAVLRNDTETKNNWLQVELIGRESNRNAVGAVMTLHTSKGSQMRLVKSGVSYLSTCDRKQLWGLPKGVSPKTLEIRWPSGKTQQMDLAAAAGTLVRLYEPTE